MMHRIAWSWLLVAGIAVCRVDGVWSDLQVLKEFRVDRVAHFEVCGEPAVEEDRR